MIRKLAGPHKQRAAAFSIRLPLACSQLLHAPDLPQPPAVPRHPDRCRPVRSHSHSSSEDSFGSTSTQPLSSHTKPSASSSSMLSCTPGSGARAFPPATAFSSALASASMDSTSLLPLLAACDRCVWIGERVGQAVRGIGDHSAWGTAALAMPDQARALFNPILAGQHRQRFSTPIARSCTHPGDEARRYWGGARRAGPARAPASRPRARDERHLCAR